MTAASPSVLPFWLSHLVATLLASATARCGSSGRTPLPDGGHVGSTLCTKGSVRVAYRTFGCGGYGSDVELGAENERLCYNSWING
eukprot:scaffold104254_cov65-Phaeocystis_antarctica.AAC.1